TAILADIDCPGRQATCLARLRHTLAMPRRDTHSAPDWLEGGDRGTRSDIAMAIYRSVADWRERRRGDPTTPPRLVLNLSVGLSPDPRAREDFEPASTAALRAALTYAACQGALVFAAAGNEHGGDDESVAGPLDPARFETVLAPDRAGCIEQGFDPPEEDEQLPVFGASRPLLYAVAAVDGNDRPLLNARPRSRSRLAAPGLEGLAEDLDGALTMPLSGSSIATAVASGTAALLWSYRPELRPDQVADLLYSGGWDTGAVADFALGTPESVHRLSVCGALAQACTGADPRTCPALSCRAGPPAGREHRRALMEGLQGLRASP
ncbi:MAG: S8/S53 family peptidase, partial [Myxococcales bacterium]|nr:S8/S53 family peptidase [Myxococcales bacterium]